MKVLVLMLCPGREVIVLCLLRRRFATYGILVRRITHGKLRIELAAIATAILNLARPKVVSMIQGQVYRCQNRACEAEFVVTRASSLKTNANPTCCCGAKMKKPYSPPVLRTLNSDEGVSCINADQNSCP
jgi:hypothetical protein